MAKRLKDFSIENSINNKQAKTLPSAVQSEKPTILYLSSVNCHLPLCIYVTEVTLYGHVNVSVQTWKKASCVKGNISAASLLLVWPEFVSPEHFRLNLFLYMPEFTKQSRLAKVGLSTHFKSEQFWEIWVQSYQAWCCLLENYRKSSIKPPGGLIYFKPTLRVGLIETGGLFERRGALINLETTMVSVLHKELECKMEKLKYKKF